MPLNPRPLRGAEHLRSTPDDGQRGFREWSRHVGEPASDLMRARDLRSDPLAVALAHPLLKVAAAAFVGYTLGRLVHRSPASAGGPSLRAASEPAGRSPRPPNSPSPARSNIRFR